MFRIPHSTKHTLNDEIERILLKLSVMQPSDDDYAQTVDQLVKLIKLKENPSKSKIDYNQLIPALASLTGIYIIVKYEQFDFITSKALGFVFKPKLS